MNKEQLLQNIDARIQEVNSYQTNIDNYSRMISKIRIDWSNDTLEFRGLDTQQIASQDIDEETFMLVADLNFKDKLQAAVRAERIEQRKALLVLEVLQDRLKELEE